MKPTKPTKLKLIYYSRQNHPENLPPPAPEKEENYQQHNQKLLDEIEKKMEAAYSPDDPEGTSYDPEELIAALRMLLEVQGNILNHQQRRIALLEIKIKLLENT